LAEISAFFEAASGELRPDFDDLDIGIEYQRQIS